MQVALDDLKKETEFGKHIVQTALDTINKDKEGGWCVLDAPGTEGFAVMAAMNHLDSPDKISVMYVTPNGNWRSAHNLDEVNEFMKEHFPDAKGFPLNKDTLTVVQKLPENVAFQDIGGAFIDIRNKMQRGHEALELEKIIAEGKIGKNQDEIELVKTVRSKKLAEYNILHAVSQLADIKLRDIGAYATMVYADGTVTDKPKDEQITGFEVTRKKTNFHKETLGKIHVDFDKDTGLVSKVSYYEDKGANNPKTIYSQNGRDIGMGFSSINSKEGREELKLLFQSLPAEVNAQVLPFIVEVERQENLNNALGKKKERVEGENQKLDKIFKQAQKENHEGFEYSIIGSRISITNDELQGSKVVMAYIDNQPRMYVETPELAALEQAVADGKASIEEYNKTIIDLTIASKDGNEWIMDEEITKEALSHSVKDASIVNEVAKAVAEVAEEFVTSEKSVENADADRHNKEADKALEEAEQEYGEA